MVQRIINNVPPAATTVDFAQQQLKICLEPCAILLLLQGQENVLLAAEYFAWSANDGSEPAKIAAWLKENSQLFIKNGLKTTVYLRTDNVMFLPSELAGSVRLLLQTQFGLNVGEGCLQKTVNENMLAGWKINSVWAEIFTDQFPGHTCQSSLAQLFAQVAFEATDTIYLAFGNGLVELIAVFNQHLQLAKCFLYDTIEDVNYHLLNICRQLKVEAAEVRISVQGFVEADAALYRSLQTFFAEVQTVQANNTLWPNALKALPAHYFTALIQAK